MQQLNQPLEPELNSSSIMHFINICIFKGKVLCYPIFQRQAVIERLLAVAAEGNRAGAEVQAM